MAAIERWNRTGESSQENFNPAIVPEAHLNWIASLSPIYVDRHRVFVHAGVDPDIPLRQQSERVLLWKLYQPGHRLGRGRRHIVTDITQIRVRRSLQRAGPTLTDWHGKQAVWLLAYLRMIGPVAHPNFWRLSVRPTKTSEYRPAPRHTDNDLLGNLEGLLTRGTQISFRDPTRLVAASALTVVKHVVGTRRRVMQLAAFAGVHGIAGNAIPPVPGCGRGGLIDTPSIILTTELSAELATILAGILTIILHVYLGWYRPDRGKQNHCGRDRQNLEGLHGGDFHIGKRSAAFH